MLHFELDFAGNLLTIIPDTRDLGEAYQTIKAAGNRLASRHDFKDFDYAIRMAAQCNELTKSKRFVPTDSGPNVSPRFDVVEVPSVGDEVSRAFNGDYYPCGKITKITHAGRRVETDDGHVFWRRKFTGSWVQQQSCFYLVAGHRRELNPSF